eukprot:16016-Prorocentrum_lima.AAC.1
MEKKWSIVTPSTQNLATCFSGFLYILSWDGRMHQHTRPHSVSNRRAIGSLRTGFDRCYHMDTRLLKRPPRGGLQR